MKQLITWVEIPVLEMERAVKFYNEVFKLSLKALDFGNEQMAFFPNDEGALSKASSFNPSTNGALVTFSIADSIEAALGRVRSVGGTIVKPKTKIESEGRGYFALITDCEGNRIGLYCNE